MLKRKIISGLILLGISGISYAQYANVEKLNESASCDSTCSIDPNKIQTLSGQSQRLGNCGYGYIGSSLEDRVVNQDGSWSDWRVVNRDNCACSPLIENQEVACPTNQKGIHIETRDWTCPTVQLGEYTAWTTKSNTCAYYYLSTSTEEQTIACPLNQRGTHIQTRNYENWSDGNARNQTAWSTKSNTCDYYLTAASQTETGTASCPAGQSGTITQIRTYDRWSDGSARNYSTWIETARNCQELTGVRTRYYSCYDPAGIGWWFYVKSTSAINYRTTLYNLGNSSLMIIPNTLNNGVATNANTIKYNNEQLSKLNLTTNNLCKPNGNADFCASELLNFIMGQIVAGRGYCNHIYVE